jgi:hypothetical protein
VGDCSGTRRAPRCRPPAACCGRIKWGCRCHQTRSCQQHLRSRQRPRAWAIFFVQPLVAKENLSSDRATHVGAGNMKKVGTPFGEVASGPEFVKEQPVLHHARTSIPRRQPMPIVCSGLLDYVNHPAQPYSAGRAVVRTSPTRNGRWSPCRPAGRYPQRRPQYRSIRYAARPDDKSEATAVSVTNDVMPGMMLEWN